MPERKLAVGANLHNLVHNRPIVVLLSLSAGLLIIAISAVFLATSALSRSNRRVEQSLQTETVVNHVTALNERIETARRGYLLAPNSAFVQIVEKAQKDFANQLNEAERLLSDDSAQMARIQTIRALESRRAGIMSDTILTPRTISSQAEAIAQGKEPGTMVARRIRAIGDQILEAEQDRLFARNRAQITSQRNFYLLGGLATLLLFVTLAAVVLLLLRYNRQLAGAQQRLREVNEGLEQAVSDRTADLTRANAEIQRFAYIVSHDLRSPLVNVLGFTSELDLARRTIRDFLERTFEGHPELRDQEAWLAVDEDLPEALDFIRKSTEKMDRLINSILELSRQGRRPLVIERLDMNVLVDGVVASLHQRAQDAGAEVVVEAIPDVESDRVAVEQIISNLAENAIKYLAPGRPGEVTVSGKKVGKTVQIAVRDNGRGIDRADHERVFDLFRRAGTQDKPGEGIGLANVRALAYRLGGTITLESALDEGAVFTLSLPERFVETTQ
ncbi:histidine kinase [Tsuneonella deserti]|uniref:histidine kinase n=1 Tax=Tsuneonella deserti TaxID=2035528 RepID=A0ABQ1S745_9SPHN|nr:sensor histidine kinase [Tsuneonella deserti]GGD94104.1 histidine kinase [Tsuneonella deserti]